MTTGQLLDKMMTATAEITGVDKADILGKVRQREFVEARALFFLVVRTSFPAITLKRVGDYMHRDHSTLIHLRKLEPKIVARSPLFVHQLEELSTVARVLLQEMSQMTSG